MKVEFSEFEVDILLKGIDSWESDTSSMMMGGLLSCLLPKVIKESEEYQRSEAENQQKAASAQKIRSEQAIMLKAKLLQLKQKVAVSELLEVTSTQT